jgi:hypothetical protein
MVTWETIDSLFGFYGNTDHLRDEAQAQLDAHAEVAR